MLLSFYCKRKLLKKNLRFSQYSILSKATVMSRHDALKSKVMIKAKYAISICCYQRHLSDFYKATCKMSMTYIQSLFQSWKKDSTPARFMFRVRSFEISNFQSSLKFFLKNFFSRFQKRFDR